MNIVVKDVNHGCFYIEEMPYLKVDRETGKFVTSIGDDQKTVWENTLKVKVLKVRPRAEVITKRQHIIRYDHNTEGFKRVCDRARKRYIFEQPINMVGVEFLLQLPCKVVACWFAASKTMKMAAFQMASMFDYKRNFTLYTCEHHWAQGKYYVINAKGLS